MLKFIHMMIYQRSLWISLSFIFLKPAHWVLIAWCLNSFQTYLIFSATHFASMCAHTNKKFIFCTRNNIDFSFLPLHIVFLSPVFIYFVVPLFIENIHLCFTTWKSKHQISSAIRAERTFFYYFLHLFVLSLEKASVKKSHLQFQFPTAAINNELSFLVFYYWQNMGFCLLISQILLKWKKESN